MEKKEILSLKGKCYVNHFTPIPNATLPKGDLDTYYKIVNVIGYKKLTILKVERFNDKEFNIETFEDSFDNFMDKAEEMYDEIEEKIFNKKYVQYSNRLDSFANII